jgi:hypothetical protein
MTDTSAENVARKTEYLRTRRISDGFDHSPGVLKLRRKPDVLSIEAADMLEALDAKLAASEDREARMREALDNLLDALTATDQIGDRCLIITGHTSNLRWLIETEDDARAALEGGKE